MLQRRNILSGLVAAGVIALAPGAGAQRVTNPIARPIPRPGAALAKGRFSTDGVASGALPGIYVVVDVDADGEAVRLRDDSGRTSLVHVRQDLFDLESLKAGDEVEVDFMVPDPGSNKLEAGGLWKVQR